MKIQDLTARAQLRQLGAEQWTEREMKVTMGELVRFWPGQQTNRTRLRRLAESLVQQLIPKAIGVRLLVEIAARQESDERPETFARAAAWRQMLLNSLATAEVEARTEMGNPGAGMILALRQRCVEIMKWPAPESFAGDPGPSASTGPAADESPAARAEAEPSEIPPTGAVDA